MNGFTTTHAAVVFLYPKAGGLRMLKILIALAIVYLSIVVVCILVRLAIALHGALEIAKLERECEEGMRRSGREQHDNGTDRQQRDPDGRPCAVPCQ